MRGRCAFRLKGRETLHGTEVQVVEYEETARPTLITSGNDDEVQAKGQLWIEKGTGVVVKTRLDTQLGDQEGELT